MVIEYRQRIRGCSTKPSGSTLPTACEDIQKYENLVREMIKIISDQIPGVKIDINFTGSICFCEANVCNVKLPEQVPGPISAAPNMSAGLALMVTCFLCFFLKI